MTKDEQKIFWQGHNRMMLKAKPYYRRKIYEALQAQIQEAIDNGLTQTAIDSISSAGIMNVLDELYQDIGLKSARRTYTNIRRQATKARMPIGFNEEIVNYIIQYFRLNILNSAVAPIMRTTKDFIREVMIKAQQTSQGLREIVNELLTADLTKVRAELIARTEMNKAANEAEQLGTDKTGFQTQKIWIATKDKRTRRDHLTTDEQVVNDGEPFSVGLEKWKMLRPGASKTTDGKEVPAKEVCNCRCVIGRKVMRGSNGLPLKKNMMQRSIIENKGMPIQVF